MSPIHFTRRGFLRAAGIGGLSAAALAARPALAQGQDHSDELISYNELFGSPPMLGRVHGASWIRMFAEPDPAARTVGRFDWGDVMPLYRGVRSVPYDARAQSPVWFETDGGYVHSAYVVPSQEVFQEPLTRMPRRDGFWAEVMTPIAWQHKQPELSSYRWDYAYYRLYWGQVYRVIDIQKDADGIVWYRLQDDIEPERQAWAQGRLLRYINPDEFKPISADVPDKRIVIALEAQTLTCYEGDIAVFQTRIASGSSFQDDEGNAVDFSTPYGDYAVQRKRPARRMRGGFEIGLGYDVNAVPWVTYFSYTGAAIHGAYWHNNFGRPRSHGCINVTPDAAKWIYRWTAPHGGYDDEYLWTEPGEVATPIQIV